MVEFFVIYDEGFFERKCDVEALHGIKYLEKWNRVTEHRSEPYWKYGERGAEVQREVRDLQMSSIRKTRICQCFHYTGIFHILTRMQKPQLGTYREAKGNFGFVSNENGDFFVH